MIAVLLEMYMVAEFVNLQNMMDHSVINLLYLPFLRALKGLNHQHRLFWALALVQLLQIIPRTGRKQFVDTIAGIRKFGGQADKVLDVMIKADESWVLGSLMKFFK